MPDKSRILLIFLFTFCSYCSNAQCISAFPSTVTFETDNGGWVPGGAASDWIWGTPAKPVITGAGEGSKCWVTGGLTRSAYNDGENSWLQTKCYDFSALSNPQVSFKVLWETEKRFDGASLQYSIDAGASWLLVGSINSNSNCDGVNWYNYSPINYLGNTDGWSGNIQPSTGSCQGGNGSGVWLTAMHKLVFLAGEPSVTFRFVFGAGTQCNAYDGFAVDNFDIRETPAIASSFSWTCNSNLSVTFNSLETFCQQNILWNFGDIGSGAGNTSDMQNPVHVFSAPGTYNVQLTIATSNNPPSTTTLPVTVISVTPNLITPILCNGQSTGSVGVVVQPAGIYSYVWNTSPPSNSQIISGLAAGNYTVTVSSPTACTTSSVFTLSEPPLLIVNSEIQPTICSNSNGSIALSPEGGTPGYNYVWSNASVNSSITNLSSGDYWVIVKDANGCSSGTVNFLVQMVDQHLNISLGSDKFICPGQQLILTPAPGSFNQYLWQDNSSNETYTVTVTGIYSVIVKDTNGCTGTASVHIIVDCSEIYFPSAFSPGDDLQNATFGALGTNVGSVTNYTLQIYNRAGQVIFQTSEPLLRWDGTYKGKRLNSQTLVWMASFTYRDKQYFEKGSLLLIK